MTSSDAISWVAALATVDQDKSRAAIGEFLRSNPTADFGLPHLIDALLRWSLDGDRVPPDLAVTVFRAALDRNTIQHPNSVEKRTVQHLSERVLGWRITLPALGPPGPTAAGSTHPGYRALSRATAVGLYPLGRESQPPTRAAHAACVAIHRCRYVHAARALTVLCGQLSRPASAEHPQYRELAEFADHALAYLNALAIAHASAALTWELRVTNAVLAAAQC